jgi:hypothetical protein
MVPVLQNRELNRVVWDDALAVFAFNRDSTEQEAGWFVAGGLSHVCLNTSKTTRAPREGGRNVLQIKHMFLLFVLILFEHFSF